MEDVLPWTEKYRPKTLPDVIGQAHIVSSLRAFVKNRNLPNLLFSGSPGIGKTTATLALAHDLYGENFSSSLLELNASVTPETPILIREGEKIKRTTFAYLAEKYYSGKECDDIAIGEGLEVLSVDKNHKIRFLSVSRLFRHKVEKVAKIKYEGGEIRTSLSHSVIVINEDGELASKKVEELQKGDHLLSFTKEIEGQRQLIGLSSYTPHTHSQLRSGLVKNPKINAVFSDKEIDEETSWMLGLYLAEGCTAFNSKGSSGQVIFTLGYPSETAVVEHLAAIFESEFGINGTFFLGRSGFDREKLSSIQFRILNTQLAKFFAGNFYNGSAKKNARTKRTPSLFFSAIPALRTEFLKGYMGDATGKWGEYVRYSSRSRENLIDIAWLGRITGIETSIFRDEVRAVWKLPTYSYARSELLSSLPLIKLVREMKDKNPKYFLRHQLYSKKSKRIQKSAIMEFAEKFGAYATDGQKKILENLKNLANSSLSSLEIKKIEIEEYDNYVYDVSVPDSEMFFGGTCPILLHNSDERGIDVVRGKIKDFARTVALEAVPFKIIFLDEADALTSDAQHALRRTMEKYLSITRFVLSCNYSSKIIEPLQSRCSVFRFLSLSEGEIKEMIERIAKTEGLQVDEEALKTLIYISEGDMRKAINALQGASFSSKKITSELIYRIASRAKPAEVDAMIQLALSGKFLEARKNLDELLIKYGMSGEDILLQIYRAVPSLEIPEEKKVHLIDKIGEYNFRMVEGANERIQLEALLAQMGVLK